MNEMGVSEVKEASAQDGTIRTALGAGVELVEQLTAGVFSIARAAQGRAITAAATAVEWLDGSQRAGLEVAREIVGRVDSTSRAALDAGEAVASAASRVLRDSGATVSAALSRSSTLVDRDAVPRRAA
jgi:hypothetical protein